MAPPTHYRPNSQALLSEFREKVQHALARRDYISHDPSSLEAQRYLAEQTRFANEIDRAAQPLLNAIEDAHVLRAEDLSLRVG